MILPSYDLLSSSINFSILDRLMNFIYKFFYVDLGTAASSINASDETISHRSGRVGITELRAKGV